MSNIMYFNHFTNESSSIEKMYMESDYNTYAKKCMIEFGDYTKKEEEIIESYLKNKDYKLINYNEFWNIRHYSDFRMKYNTIYIVKENYDKLNVTDINTSISIYKLDDEYYFLVDSRKSYNQKSHYYLCDQLEGIKQCIDDKINNIIKENFNGIMEYNTEKMYKKINLNEYRKRCEHVENWNDKEIKTINLLAPVIKTNRCTIVTSYGNMVITKLFDEYYVISYTYYENGNKPLRVEQVLCDTFEGLIQFLEDRYNKKINKMIDNKMTINEDAKPKDFEPIKSFKTHNVLYKKVWDGWKLKPEIREQLFKVANDYLDYLDIKLNVKDIVLVGSYTGFNWSKYSDFDVHFLIDFSKDDNAELTKKYLDVAEKLWKQQHDIQIINRDVELYCQDINADNATNGMYSLKKGDWIKKPEKIEFKLDEPAIKRKAERIIDDIDDIESNYKSGISFEELQPDIKKVWTKIKTMRKTGLDREGEFSVENLVFKLLRRNGAIGKLLEIRRKAYDKQFK